MFQEDLPLIVHEMSVREIRREEERRERERREGIERRQREIRRRRGVQSADGACGTGPVAAQLRQRLLEISAGHAGSVGAAEDAAPPRWSIDEGSAAHTADALTLSQFLHDDWERTQRQHAGSPGLPSDAADEAGVVLRPSENAGAARLASLMAMGQTLSPYTRRFAHTTMRADVSARAAYSLAEPLSPPAQSATPFSGSGVRSPFARTRKVRRKVHRLGNTE
ncbi:hypothetical protein IW150_006721 [Coemansia sp. RSA 2607]|nr:hypothetical protein IW150_006721 [Coemansia sp. RSA 2607]